MTASDVGSVPISHQGDAATVLARIESLGSSAMLAFDGDQHVGQLQFRRYEPGTRSPSGVWDPLWWMDFESSAPALPAEALSICCFHIGQLDDTDRREPSYQQRGIASALLDHFLEWADEREFSAVIAKASPAHRSVMNFLGGLPAPCYEARGFAVMASWEDSQLARILVERRLRRKRAARAPTVSACVRLRPS